MRSCIPHLRCLRPLQAHQSCRITYMADYGCLQDNTIADRPVVELVASLNHMLDKARHSSASGSMASAALSQLVLIVSDGRFHEKESLRRAVVVSQLARSHSIGLCSKVFMYKPLGAQKTWPFIFLKQQWSPRF